MYSQYLQWQRDYISRRVSSNACLFASTLNAVDGSGTTDADIAQMLYDATIGNDEIYAPTQLYNLDHLASGLPEGVTVTDNSSINSVADIRNQLELTGQPVFVVGTLGDSQLGQSGGFMQADGEIPHWLIVTGVSEDGQIVRVVNSINQREEFYMVTEFEANLRAEAIRQGGGNPEDTSPANQVSFIGGTITFAQNQPLTG